VLAEGKETRRIDGRDYVLEYPIRGDVALVRAHASDPFGNLVYRKTARNFGPVMAAAATLSIIEVSESVARIDPEAVVTPSIYVDQVVVVPAAEVADDDGDNAEQHRPRVAAS
jgi:3-oxoadipate CoA-transferase alpha subunit